jgi:hypothetical protein
MTKTYTTIEGLFVEYTLDKDKGTYIDPPCLNIEINKIQYEGTDVTDLLYEIADDYCWSLTEKLEEING